MEPLSKLAFGKIGETLVELELEKQGWMVFIPHFEERIDFVAVKRVHNEFKYAGIQVKSSKPVHLKGEAYGVAIKRSKLVEASSFTFSVSWGRIRIHLSWFQAAV